MLFNLVIVRGFLVILRVGGFFVFEIYMCREVDEFIIFIFKINLLLLIKYFINIVILI